MSSAPKDLVGLRQGRFEAFKSWETPSIIASIPALLELALILFLGGLVIFLYTLNIIVAGICTVVIVLLIALAVVMTILPVFHPDCPYKTPTGWALVLVVCRWYKLWYKFKYTMLYAFLSLSG